MVQAGGAHLVLQAPAGAQEPANNVLLAVDARMLECNLHTQCCAVSGMCSISSSRFRLLS